MRGEGGGPEESGVTQGGRRGLGALWGTVVTCQGALQLGLEGSRKALTGTPAERRRAAALLVHNATLLCGTRQRIDDVCAACSSPGWVGRGGVLLLPVLDQCAVGTCLQYTENEAVYHNSAALLIPRPRCAAAWMLGSPAGDAGAADICAGGAGPGRVPHQPLRPT